MDRPTAIAKGKLTWNRPHAFAVNTDAGEETPPLVYYQKPDMGRIQHREHSKTAINAPWLSSETIESTGPGTAARTELIPAPLRRLFALLSAASLLAFSLWTVLLLIRSHQLRHELEHHLARLDEVRQVRDLLEPWQRAPASPETVPETVPETLPETLPDTSRRPFGETDGTRPGELGPPVLDGAIQRLTFGDLASPEDDEALRFTVRNLRQALEELAAAEEETTRWDASQRALVSATSLEARLQHRVAGQLRRLDEHWWAFDRLVAVSLMLGLLCWLLLHRGQRRRSELEASRRLAAEQALHDRLTGLWNRTAILSLLRDELARAARSRSPLGVILLDIDHFKELNVLLGEDQGDFILEQLAARLNEKVRPYDALGRLGGDSFLVVLPACDATATGTVANRLRESVNGHDVEHGLGRIRITLSMAFTTLHQTAEVDPHLLIHRLEDRLAQPHPNGPTAELGRVVTLDEDPAAA